MWYCLSWNRLYLMPLVVGIRPHFSRSFVNCSQTHLTSSYAFSAKWYRLLSCELIHLSLEQWLVDGIPQVIMGFSTGYISSATVADIWKVFGESLFSVSVWPLIVGQLLCNFHDIMLSALFSRLVPSCVDLIVQLLLLRLYAVFAPRQSWHMIMEWF